MKVDLFKSNVPAEEVDKIQRVNIFKTKETDNQPSVILCMPTVNGEKLKPREISPSQWQRMWIAENMQDYKKHLAASLFADVLRKDRTDAVAVGTEKSEQEAQSNEVKQNTAQQEEDKATEEQKEETPEKKEQKQKEEKAKEEKTKAETKAAVVAMTPMLKQFYKLKGKHPDAVLLFRCGDFYETYSQDAEKASKILGITLTRVPIPRMQTASLWPWLGSHTTLSTPICQSSSVQENGLPSATSWKPPNVPLRKFPPPR